MKKRVILGLFLIFFLFPLVSASLSDEIQKVTHHAEEYETGNINYVQLLVYTSAVRESINEILGSTEKEFGGILKIEQLAPLGDPTEDTKWVWVENEEHEVRFDEPLPVWRKVIFDGKKIQIRMNAWPSIFRKDGEERLFYRLHFEINFKKPEEQLDIKSKIDEIKSLAETFNKAPTKDNAIALAKESVSTERSFESFMRQRSGQCEDLMKEIFGSENKRGTQKIILQEISFVEGENFEAIARLEMCDECEWNWVNLDLWIEGRGPGFRMPKEDSGLPPKEQFKHLDNEGFMREITKELDMFKMMVSQGNFEAALRIKPKINALNWAWNEKANDVWEQVEKEFSISNDQQSEQQEPYYWIKREQERRQRERDLRRANYELRKKFYTSFFFNFDKREFFFTQTEFEKRLVEVFKEFGEEICNNQEDDNDNGKIDCEEDDQCGGKICGRQNVLVTADNQSREEVRDLYCIEKTCQLKEEEEEKEAVCGNHICEAGEELNCTEDCTACPEHPPIECEGKVIFKGKDELGCPLEPVCIEKNESCSVDEDCIQPLCGTASCVDEMCEITELGECEEEECVAGDEIVKVCSTGEEIISDICEEGKWVETEFVCPEGEEPQENVTVPEEPEVPEEAECTVVEDCGNPDDVCSNGECVTIPEVIDSEEEEEEEEFEEELEEYEEELEEEIEELEEEVEEEIEEEFEEPEEEEEQEQPEEPEEPEPEPQEQESEPEPEPEPQEQESEPEPEPEPQEQSPVTGEASFLSLSFLRSIAGKITGLTVDNGDDGSTDSGSDDGSSDSEPPADDSNDEPPAEEPPEESDEPPAEEPPSEEPPEDGEESPGPEPPEDHDEDDDEREERRDDRREREGECKEQSEEQCKRRYIEPCVGDCVFENDQTEGEIEACEQSCEEEHRSEIDECTERCSEGCEQGEWCEIEWPNPEHKEEKGVFTVGGGCRSAASRTEGYLWFGGWGEPFKEVDSLKHKFYQRGETDWCKEDLENLIKQRREFEKGFNEEFVVWFFEDYLINSAEDWEQHTSGIFELYWRDVDLSRQTAERLNCLNKKELPPHNLINIEYETDFGKLEFWEEIRTVKLPGFDRSVELISPYMKIWIYPPKEFISYEMKKSMETGEFPGPPEEKREREREEGPTEEEKEMIRQDKKFMEIIREATEDYDGYLDVSIQLRDYEKDEVVFNLYVQINEEDIVKIKPMLPSQMPEVDVTAEIDFEDIYDLILMGEKDMRGEMTESPPWDRKSRPVERVKQVVNGVRMWFKVRGIINSAKISPESSAKEMRSLGKTFIRMMMEGDERGPPGEEEKEGKEPEAWEDVSELTGEVIRE